MQDVRHTTRSHTPAILVLTQLWALDAHLDTQVAMQDQQEDLCTSERPEEHNLILLVLHCWLYPGTLTPGSHAGHSTNCCCTPHTSATEHLKPTALQAEI
jgi:hypothetical protein